MRKVDTVPCRICGKEFVPCNQCYRVTGKFNWREMCCSIECGDKYLQAVEQARNPRAKLQADSNQINKELVSKRKKKT